MDKKVEFSETYFISEHNLSPQTLSDIASHPDLPSGEMAST